AASDSSTSQRTAISAPPSARPCRFSCPRLPTPIIATRRRLLGGGVSPRTWALHGMTPAMAADWRNRRRLTRLMGVGPAGDGRDSGVIPTGVRRTSPVRYTNGTLQEVVTVGESNLLPPGGGNAVQPAVGGATTFSFFRDASQKNIVHFGWGIRLRFSH